MNSNVLIAPLCQCKDDFLDSYNTWVHDEEVTKYLYQGTFPLTEDEIKKVYDDWTSKHNVVYFLYYHDETCNIEPGDIFPIGVVGIYDINYPSRVGEFRILLGDKDYWGKGIGSDCLKLMTKLAFEKYNLHKFWLGYNANHVGAGKAYSKCGFIHECTLKEHHFRNGVYNDLKRMYMLEDDYKEWQSKLG